MPGKWEYMVLRMDFSAEVEFKNGKFVPGYQHENKSKLNALGDEGWELVTAVREPDLLMTVVVLKREKA